MIEAYMRVRLGFPVVSVSIFRSLEYIAIIAKCSFWHGGAYKYAAVMESIGMETDSDRFTVFLLDKLAAGINKWKLEQAWPHTMGMG
jgi:hypothetical protein